MCHVWCPKRDFNEVWSLSHLVVLNERIAAISWWCSIPGFNLLNLCILRTTYSWSVLILNRKCSCLFAYYRKPRLNPQLVAQQVAQQLTTTTPKPRREGSKERKSSHLIGSQEEKPAKKKVRNMWVFKLLCWFDSIGGIWQKVVILNFFVTVDLDWKMLIVRKHIDIMWQWTMSR